MSSPKIKVIVHGLNLKKPLLKKSSIRFGYCIDKNKNTVSEPTGDIYWSNIIKLYLTYWYINLNFFLNKSIVHIHCK